MIKVNKKVVDKIEAIKKLSLIKSIDSIKEEELLSIYKIIPDNTKKHLVSLLNLQKNKLLKGTITFNNNDFQINYETQTAINNILFLVNQGYKENISWRTADNEIIQLTTSEFLNLSKSIILETQNILKKIWEIKDSIESATSGKEIFTSLRKLA